MNAPANLPARLPMPPTVHQQGITPAQWKVLTEAIFPAAKSPEAVELAIAYCRSRNLDIMRRPVHIVPMWNRELDREVETVWPGINEVQVTASRTGQWAGMDPPRWGPDQERHFAGKTRNGAVAATVVFPEWCEVTVYRLIEGQRCAFTETVYWLETYSRIGRTEVPNDMWQRRARSQLAKCAKAASLRAAFPEEGEYVAEEMEGKEYAGGVTIDARAEPAPEPAPKARKIKLYGTGGPMLEEYDRISAFLDGFEKLWKLDRKLLSHPANVRTLEQIVERTDPGQVRELVEDWLVNLREDIAALEPGP